MIDSIIALIERWELDFHGSHGEDAYMGRDEQGNYVHFDDHRIALTTLLERCDKLHAELERMADITENRLLENTALLQRCEKAEAEAERIKAINVKHCEAVNTLVVDGSRWQTKAETAERERDQARKALREMFCPRPCNGRPDDFDAGDCVDAGECGCAASGGLTGENADSASETIQKIRDCFKDTPLVHSRGAIELEILLAAADARIAELEAERDLADKSDMSARDLLNDVEAKLETAEAERDEFEQSLQSQCKSTADAWERAEFLLKENHGLGDEICALSERAEKAEARAESILAEALDWKGMYLVSAKNYDEMQGRAWKAEHNLENMRTSYVADNHLIVDIKRQLADARKALTELQEDKVEGLEADLDNAIETAFKRGAVEWTKLNYPEHYKRLSSSATLSTGRESE